MSRKLLQVANALVGVATVVLGATQLAFGSDSPLYAAMDLPAGALLDSNLRFFGGLGLGLGLILLWILPTIERRTELFQAVWLCAFLGGVGRALSMVMLGSPPAPLVVFTVLEVAGAPVFVFWQKRVAP